MSLQHAILGFLNYGPSTGYDLKKVFDRSVNHFWPADQSQIYRTLSQLAEASLAEVEIVHQNDVPDRKVYHITEAGREKLMEWLTNDIPATKIRSRELIQVFFAGQLNEEQALGLFQRGLSKSRERLATFYLLQEKSLREHPRSQATGQQARDVFFWQLTLENGIVTTEALVRWIESVIERLAKQDYTAFPANTDNS